MKTRWRAPIVAGVVVVLLGSQVMGQEPTRGQGRGRAPAHRAAGPNQAGATMIPHSGGPMGLGGGVFCCPLGPAHSSVLGPLAWSLNLTDEQIKQVRGIYDQVRTDANSVTQRVATAGIALHEVVTNGATEAEIRAAATTLGAAIGDQAALHAKVLEMVKAVLTDEQRKELEKIQMNSAPPQHQRGPAAGNAGPRRPNPAAGGPAREQIQHQQ